MLLRNARVFRAIRRAFGHHIIGAFPAEMIPIQVAVPITEIAEKRADPLFAGYFRFNAIPSAPK
jgi:hypothetical protein